MYTVNPRAVSKLRTYDNDRSHPSVWWWSCSPWWQCSHGAGARQAESVSFLGPSSQETASICIGICIWALSPDGAGEGARLRPDRHQPLPTLLFSGRQEHVERAPFSPGAEASVPLRQRGGPFPFQNRVPGTTLKSETYFLQQRPSVSSDAGETHLTPVVWKYFYSLFQSL